MSKKRRNYAAREKHVFESDGAAHPGPYCLRRGKPEIHPEDGFTHDFWTELAQDMTPKILRLLAKPGEDKDPAVAEIDAEIIMLESLVKSGAISEETLRPALEAAYERRGRAIATSKLPPTRQRKQGARRRP